MFQFIHVYMDVWIGWWTNSLYWGDGWKQPNIHRKLGFLEFLVLEKDKYSPPQCFFHCFFPGQPMLSKRHDWVSMGLWEEFFNFIDAFQCVSRFHSNFTPITAWVYSTGHFADAYKCAIVSRVPEMRLFLSHWVRMKRRNKLALAVFDLLHAQKGFISYWIHPKNPPDIYNPISIQL